MIFFSKFRGTASKIHHIFVTFKYSRLNATEILNSDRREIFREFFIVKRPHFSNVKAKPFAIHLRNPESSNVSLVNAIAPIFSRRDC